MVLPFVSGEAAVFRVLCAVSDLTVLQGYSSSGLTAFRQQANHKGSPGHASATSSGWP